jgi:hypothetical protein
MSWNFTATGNNREETLLVLEVQAKRYDRPKAQVDQIVRWASVLTEGMPDSSVRTISTFGHINVDGSGSVRMSINS